MHLPACLAAAILCLLTWTAAAAPKISGECSYEFLNGEGKVSIGITKITNPGSGTTGTLMVQLWALTAPYKSGRISGHVLGSYKLDPLRPGNMYALPNKVVACTQPAARRDYYLCITVSEYADNGYVIRDFSNFARTLTLGTPPKLFTLDGPTKWQTDYQNNRLEIGAGKVAHTRPGKTGTLRLAVWATQHPYKGGAITGYQIGYAELKALDPGYSYTDVKRTVALTAPPEGRYYVTIALMEYDGGSYVIREWTCSKNASSFPAPRTAGAR